MSMLRLHDLYLARGSHAIAEALSMNIDAGKVIAVLGPNGAGKSSLLLALAGMLPVQSGRIELGESNIRELSRRHIARHLAWQGELPPTEFGLTVKQRLELAMQDGQCEALQQVAAELDIDHLLTRMLGELSTGERQRAELAAVLLRDCPVLLLDEPTAHLDLRHQSTWLALMREQADMGKAVVSVLHDVQQAACAADIVVFIYGDGRVAHGDAEAMLVPDRLEALFHMPILRLEEGQLIVPDYRRTLETA